MNVIRNSAKNPVMLVQKEVRRKKKFSGFLMTMQSHAAVSKTALHFGERAVYNGAVVNVVAAVFGDIAVAVFEQPLAANNAV